MLNILHVPLAAVAASMLFQLAAQGATPASEAAVSTAISGQLSRYEQARNSADIERIMSLYARDPVFMPQNGSPAVGREAVLRAYGHVFDSIKLNVRFEIDEFRLLSDEWAYARTRSRGTVTRLGNAVPPGPEATRICSCCVAKPMVSGDPPATSSRPPTRRTERPWPPEPDPAAGGVETAPS